MEKEYLNESEAIRYLIANSEYVNEWTGAGMWECVLKLIDNPKKITPRLLDEWLLKAKNR